MLLTSLDQKLILFHTSKQKNLCHLKQDQEIYDLDVDKSSLINRIGHSLVTFLCIK